MPTENGVGLNEDQRRPPAAPRAGEQHPEHPIRRTNAKPLDASWQGSQLVSQGDILKDDFLVSAAGQGDRAEEQQ
jgi:hypothetical protein